MRLLFALLTALSLSCIALVRTENFSLDAIQGPLIAESDFPVQISGTYRFLASGRQAYAFVSEDGKTVLKFFKKSYYEVPWYTRLLPSSFRKREMAKRSKRQQFYRQGYRIAAEQFQEETGVLFAHFGPSKEKLPCVHLVDKAHRSHTIDLNEVPFVLQKRAEPFYPFLLGLYEQKGIEAVKQTLALFVAQISERIAKGIADGDQEVEGNFGWLDGKVLHFDPGRFYCDGTLEEPARRKLEWWRGTHFLRAWLAEHIPEALPFFEEKIS